jgi:hypothetical protein
MTIQHVRNKLRALGLSFRKTEAGDFRVNLSEGTEATAYYTDCLVDALQTGVAMRERQGVPS